MNNFKDYYKPERLFQLFEPYPFCTKAGENYETKPENNSHERGEIVLAGRKDEFPIPNDVLRIIFERLPFQDLRSCLSICKRFYYLAKNRFYILAPSKIDADFASVQNKINKLMKSDTFVSFLGTGANNSVRIITSFKAYCDLVALNTFDLTQLERICEIRGEISKIEQALVKPKKREDEQRKKLIENFHIKISLVKVDLEKLINKDPS